MTWLRNLNNHQSLMISSIYKAQERKKLRELWLKWDMKCLRKMIQLIQDITMTSYKQCLIQICIKSCKFSQSLHRPILSLQDLFLLILLFLSLLITIMYTTTKLKANLLSVNKFLRRLRKATLRLLILDYTGILQLHLMNFFQMNYWLKNRLRQENIILFGNICRKELIEQINWLTMLISLNNVLEEYVQTWSNKWLLILNSNIALDNYMMIMVLYHLKKNLQFLTMLKIHSSKSLRCFQSKFML